MENLTVNPQEANELVVLWTSADREVALKMVFMYTFNAKTKGWWEDVCLIVWGPSSKLLSEDQELQAYMAKMIEAGVEVVACKACTDSYGITNTLEKLGIEVKYMGQPLTNILKRDAKLITF
ncbi:DsrE family protein [Desulfosporosinus sp. FKB]|uniref:DsrE family protein n=1 Tax=Desulfosporosinus sp. FKB TaxID=1969835 RepID=UPI001FA8CA29|nr:DsrE family protein [Desulfosporosinus sp. FKB]